MSISSIQENLAIALESSPDIIMFSLDAQYRYTSFSSSHKAIMKKIWGVDIKPGDNMLEFLPLADRAKAKRNFDRALAGERFSVVEEYGAEILRRAFWEDRYDPIIDASGNITGLVVFVLDVSKFIKTAQTLEDTQTTLKLALKATRTGVWEWMIGKDELFWSDEVYEIFGINKNEGIITFEKYKNSIHPDDRKRVAAGIQDTLATGKEYLIEYRIIRDDNTIRWVKGLGVLFYDVHGKQEKMLGTVQDITEFEQAEREKRERDIRYDLLVKSSGQMIYDYNTQTGKIEWSGSTQEVLGFSTEEMGDIEQWSRLIHPDDRDQILTQLEQAHNSLSKFDVTYRFQHHDGYYKILSDRGFFFKEHNNGGNVRMLGIMEDITREKEAESDLIIKNEELTKANRELDRFVYSASHDLRAPIASLMGLIKVARLENSLDNLELLLKMQERTLTKLDSFIKDIVDHSRNSRLAVAYEAVNFHRAIEESFEHLTFLDNQGLLGKKIIIEQPVNFFSDRSRIQIILNNLISNSIKYADIKKENPYIKISVKITQENAVISIEDNGEGIRKEMQEKIFDMFVRATERSTGSGLGLYIVKEVVEKLEGKIEVYSEPELGSTFTVTLPNHNQS